MTKKNKFFVLIILVMGFIQFNISSIVYASSGYQRVSGNNRYLTSIQISKSGWTDGNSQNAVLVTGDDYPDALCASPLARKLNAPILLTGKLNLDKDVENELNRLSAKNIFIVGGEGVISKKVKDYLESKGFNVTRLWGKDRYETSLKVAHYLEVNPSKEIAIATGVDFPDALSIAPIAAKKNMAIILSPKDDITDGIRKYIGENGILKSYIIGGTSVISEKVKNQLPGAERISGNTRGETNIAVLNKFKNSNDIEFGTVYIATSADFPDALAGSALAAKTSSPIVLVDKVPAIVTKEFMSNKILSTTQLKVLGGESVVYPKALAELIPKITSINTIVVDLYEGESYKLPSSVTTALSNNSTKEVLVSWSPASIDTSKAGTYTFQGSVDDFDNKVVLTVKINPLSIIKHSILGEPEVTADQMAKYLLDRNSEPKISISIKELAQLFLDEGRAEGIRGDIAFCQSIHETGAFNYGGQVLPEQNNYAGIGATNGSPIGKGAWFATPQEGVRAQIQHLKAYASKERPNGEIVDPRYEILETNNLLGIAPNWEDLAGRWAVPGYDPNKYQSIQEAMINGDSYGQNIYKRLELIKAVQVQ